MRSSMGEVGEVRPILIAALGMTLMAAFILPSGSQQLDFAFTCEGSNSTMASYSYVKEPSLLSSRCSQSCSYTRGFKSGSFNYLENGFIDVDEKIIYKYDNGTSELNTSLSHNLEVNFNGTRGISEFYGKAFFGNNRAVSAWKKIRYENLSRWENVSIKNNKTASLGKARTAKNFSVIASVKMDSDIETEVESYVFDYQAKIKDGVIETKDAAGWSNRTGMNRIDFEHDSLMSGEQLNITNVLKDSAPFPVEAGGGNWLTCCFSGTVPEIEAWSGCECANDSGNCSMCDNANGYWPDEGVYGTLAPDMKLPNARLVRVCRVDPWGEIRCTEPKYEPISCNGSNCSNFECIYGIGLSNRTDISGTGAGKRSEFAKFASIKVSQTYASKPTGAGRTEVTYDITITNSGVMELSNVTLNDTLPAGMSYINSSYRQGGSPALLVHRNTTSGKNHVEIVSLSLGNLSTSDTKFVKLVAVHEGEKKGHNYYASNKVEVLGEAPDRSMVNDTAKPAPEPSEDIGQNVGGGFGRR